MADDPENLEKQKKNAEQSQGHSQDSDGAAKSDSSKSGSPKSDSSKSDSSKSDSSKSGSSKSDSSKSDRFKRFNLPRVGLPKFDSSQFRLPKPKLPFKKINFLGLWLGIILISYVCMGYFLAVLMTIPAHKNLAIAGFTIVGLFPIITAFADYALMKWGYLISGLLIVGGLVFVIRLKFYLSVVAIVVWVGLTAIAFVGEVLTKKRKFWIAIVILTIPCLIGLGLGYQLWKLATSWS
ncbi:hypothetical protein [Pseudanabaena sp. 'Roaring Creek']|uniref:hypothetical protein n=1 Tax=Pseudanabaena sp. 'Roaring Creek' TaxID=1681830 RepID=UPI0006D82CD6|nr:hypothetical protein [Pseudanabaena sp. 'Roaring Creek']